MAEQGAPRELQRVLAQGVCWLTLSRPERGNALSPALVEALLSAVAQASADPDVHTLVLAA